MLWLTFLNEDLDLLLAVVSQQLRVCETLNSNVCVCVFGRKRKMMAHEQRCKWLNFMCKSYITMVY